MIDHDKQKYVTSSGKVVTGKDLDELAEAFESGDYEPTVVRPRGRPLLGSAPARVIQFRLEPELEEELNKRAKSEHKTNSEILREALQRYLAS